MQDSLKAPDNHCPFGCGSDELDSHGYCEHLLGFSSDGKTFEPLGMQMKWNKEDKAFRETGHSIVARKNYEGKNIVQRVQPNKGDVLVNPTKEFYDNQAKINVKSKSWVSSRVYNKKPDREPILVDGNKNAALVGAES